MRGTSWFSETLAPCTESRASARATLEVRRVSYYNSLVEIHPSARKHGIADEDIQHAVSNAMTIDDQENDTRLYLGPSHAADLLEVVTIVRADDSELAIHAMKMRAKYRPLLGGG